MDKVKDQKEILEKLGIENLNPMQEKALAAIRATENVVLLSPTGTGKTLAFLLPLIENLDPSSAEVQALVLAPSRELAIQIEQVLKEMGSGYKTNAVYGGRSFSKDKQDLKHPPAILIGTPGRVADHLRKGTFSAENITALVLDEFDKSLEVGFEGEMKEIMGKLPRVKKKILTSATQQVEIPAFVNMSTPTTINFLDEGTSRLSVQLVESPDKDKLETLAKLLKTLGDQPGIVFCNFKDSIQRVSDFLEEKRIKHGCFYGGMEQQDRERALIKFRNGTHRLLLATDLAARGIDVPEISFIIHFHLPMKGHEFTHRNGRTARVNERGTAYILKWKNEELPDFIKELEPGTYHLNTSKHEPKPADWQTLYISGGRRDKISKGDIAGLFFKQGNLNPDQLGLIEIKQDCAFVSVPASTVDAIIPLLDNSRIKKKKVRVRVV